MPAESGEMGVLANHVPSIEQLKPGLVEVIEENGGSKQFFRKSSSATCSLSCATSHLTIRSVGWICYRPAWIEAQHQRC